MTARHNEWLARAENDLAFARVGLKEGFYSQVCFLSQQAAEKSLKGALVALGRIYPKSHNLRELALKIPEIDFKKHIEALTVLDGYYVPLRYPDAIPGTAATGEPNKTEAAAALKTAEQIFSLVAEFISAIKA